MTTCDSTHAPVRRTRLRVESLEDRALPSVLFHDDMENDLNGWTLAGDTSLWHLTTVSNDTPTTAWAYNQESGNTPTSYDTGYMGYDWEGFPTGWVSTPNSGTLTSPPIDLTGETQVTLTFAESLDIGTTASSGPDHAGVLVSTDGVTYTPISTPTVTGSGWVVESVDLSAFAGQTVNIQFAFDTVDEYDNAHGGWSIDDVTVTGGSDRPALSVEDATVTESPAGATAVFAVSLSGPSTSAVTVHYATGDGSATAGGDFTATVGNLTFAPGETTKTVAVPVLDDRLGEWFESFSLDLSGQTNATLIDSHAVGTILDDEPVLSAYGVRQNEGNTGTTPFNFRFVLSHSYDQPVTVHYATANGSTDYWSSAAVAGSDFIASAGDLTFAPGETEKVVAVAVVGDRTPEGPRNIGPTEPPTENFSVVLSSPSANVALLGTRVSGVIVDEEPTVSIGNAQVTEGNSGTTPMAFPVTLSWAYDAPISVSYQTLQPGPYGPVALPGSDYVAASGTFTFAPGQTVGSIVVQVIGDRVYESSQETFGLIIFSPTSAAVGTYTGTGTIIDDDPPAKVSISDASVREGNSGSVYLVFTVTRSGNIDTPSAVNYWTSDGTATTSDHDYRGATGTLNFAPGETSKTISILIYGDRKKEANETFFLNLSNSFATDITDGQGVGTILNDD
jgi:hypothetical protein